MDKKQPNYSRQGSNKALTTDSRKASDVYSSKPWPKNPRRRENANLPAKNDPQRKLGPAKVRCNVDKRPKPRGGSYGSGGLSTFDDLSAPSSGLAPDNTVAIADEDEGHEDFEIELNSVYTPGSKKQNLNHLLNFHYNAREDSAGALGVFGRNGNRGHHTKKHKYNKEQFLQANFQFVIKSNAEAKLVSSLPDTLIDWGLIEQINIQTTEEPQCPICLFPPVAAKLTRCGHAYCWPCILHYLALTDKNWRKCPICYEAIHLSDLKSTAIVQQVNYSVGHSITLQLMRRKRGSMLIEKFKTGKADDKIPHLSALNDDRKFSKFLIADCHEILSIIERERQELMTGEDPDCPEFVFIQQALDLMKERKDGLLKELKIDERKMEKLKLTEADDEHEEEPASEDAADTASVGRESIEDDDPSKYYYFYQSEDGQNVYLHPLNVKMLQAMYGTLDQGPPVISGRIVQKENQSMDEALRRKFTCLGHLPLTCQFEIVEIDLRPPFVSQMILDAFKDDIVLRQKTRQRREREEKKREKQINEINDRQMGKLIARSANIDISSDQQFPVCGFDEPLGDFPSFDQAPMSPAKTLTVRNSYASFANVLTSPTTKDFWPTLNKPATASNFANESLWVKPQPVARRAQNDRLSESECSTISNEEVVQMPATHSLGDVLAEAIQQKQIKTPTGAPLNNNSGANKKSKKTKKMLLFSTGMNYKGN